MIVVLSADAPPELGDVDRLDRLHAESPGPLEVMRFDDLCTPAADADHVWLSIDAARRAGLGRSSDPSWGARFDGMIAYAASKGWLNDAGTHVRAHVESAG